MDMEFARAGSITLAINLLYAVLALFVGVAALRLVDKVLLKRIDLQEEIGKGNVAAAIFAAALLLFVATVLGLALTR